MAVGEHHLFLDSLSEASVGVGGNSEHLGTQNWSPCRHQSVWYTSVPVRWWRSGGAAVPPRPRHSSCRSGSLCLARGSRRAQK